MCTKAKEFHCARVSSTADGIGAQVLFQNTDASDKGYFLVQRHFELPDSGACYVETDDEDFCGHYHIRTAKLSRNWFSITFGRSPHMQLKVLFDATDSDFGEVKRVLKIMIPELEFDQ